MILEKIAGFLWMGGYGVYIWSAYGVTLVLLILPIIRTLYLMRKAKKHV